MTGSGISNLWKWNGNTGLTPARSSPANYLMAPSIIRLKQHDKSLDKQRAATKPLGIELAPRMSIPDSFGGRDWSLGQLNPGTCIRR